MVAEMATGKQLFQPNNEDDFLLSCMERLGVPPRNFIHAAPYGLIYFGGWKKPYSLPGSFPLHSVLKSQDTEFVDFISHCLQWDPNLRMTPTQALAHSWLQGMAEVHDQGAATATTSTTITTATTTTTASSVQGLIALRSREEGSGEYDAKSGAAEPRVKPVQPTSLAQTSEEETEVVVENEGDQKTEVEEEEKTEEQDQETEEETEEEMDKGANMVEEEKMVVEEMMVQEVEKLENEVTDVEEEEETEETAEEEPEEEEPEETEEPDKGGNMVVEEMMVQVFEKLEEEKEMKEMNKKRGCMARVGRAIRSLLRRVLLCGGRSTPQ
ncbi:uncharacterized protein LOC144722561 [Lampetra planeri]